MFEPTQDLFKPSGFFDEKTKEDVVEDEKVEEDETKEDE